MATMANLLNYYDLDQRQRKFRYFSESFKKKKVEEIEKNLVTISEICKEYLVSRTSVYKWLYKYSFMRKKQERQVVELKSDTKKIKHLKARIKELEQIVGQKQILIDFKEKMIELAEEQYGIDIKKKYGSKVLSGSGQIEENTSTK
jgi:transposase-like protein